MAHSRSFAFGHTAHSVHCFQPWWDGSVARGETEPGAVLEAQRSADMREARLTIDELIQRCEGMESS